jgi:hypothetical protein
MLTDKCCVNAVLVDGSTESLAKGIRRARGLAWAQPAQIKGCNVSRLTLQHTTPPQPAGFQAGGFHKQTILKGGQTEKVKRVSHSH